jgi:hypothetical protein
LGVLSLALGEALPFPDEALPLEVDLIKLSLPMETPLRLGNIQPAAAGSKCKF